MVHVNNQTGFILAFAASRFLTVFSRINKKETRTNYYEFHKTNNLEHEHDERKDFVNVIFQPVQQKHFF